MQACQDARVVQPIDGGLQIGPSSGVERRRGAAITETKGAAAVKVDLGHSEPARKGDPRIDVGEGDAVEVEQVRAAIARCVEGPRTAELRVGQGRGILDSLLQSCAEVVAVVPPRGPRSCRRVPVLGRPAHEAGTPRGAALERACGPCARRRAAKGSSACAFNLRLRSTKASSSTRTPPPPRPPGPASDVAGESRGRPASPPRRSRGEDGPPPAGPHRPRLHAP